MERSGATSSYSLAELRSLCSKIEAKAWAARRPAVATLPASWEAETVEAIRQLAEVVVYGERQGDRAYVEAVVESKLLATLVSLVASSSPVAVQTQVLQTMSILAQNVRHSSSLYLMLSSNHVNELVERGELQLSSDEETQATFVSFLKTLSLRLDAQTIQFFVDDKADTFALHDCAVRYMEHRDPMARASALTTVLNIYRIDDAHARRFVTRPETRDAFHRKFARLVRTEVDGLAAAVGRDEKRRREATDVRCGRLEDSLYYARDVLSLGVDAISEPFQRALLVDFVEGYLVTALENEAHSPPTAAAAALAAAALFRACDDGLGRAAWTALAPALASKVLGGGQTAYEPLAAASLLALDAGRRLNELGHASSKASAKAKSLLDDLVEPALDASVRADLFGDAVEKATSSLPRKASAPANELRAVARRNLVASLDNHDEFRVVTLRLVVEALDDLVDGDRACRASVRTSVSTAAARLLADLDDASADAVVDTIDARAAAPLATRRVSSDDGPPPTMASRLGLADALFGPDDARPGQALLVLLDALDRNLAPALSDRLDDARELTVDNVDRRSVATDLAGRRCVPCSVLRAPSARDDHRTLDWLDLYLVFDDCRLLLAVPDPLALAKGRVLSSAPLHAVQCIPDPHNGTKLDLAVCSRYPLGLAIRDPPDHNNAVRHTYRLALIFESERNCRVARTFLAEKRALMRAKRLDDLRRLLGLLVHDPFRLYQA